MKSLLKFVACALLAISAAGLFVAPSLAGGPKSPPNWKVSAEGGAVIIDAYVEGGDLYLVDADKLGGISTHVGKFTAEGEHTLNTTTGAFVGYATWTAKNGDQLNVTYEGAITGYSGDPAYPYGAEAIFVIDGGTGRFASAKAVGQMTGAFTGDPDPEKRKYYFDIKGTFHPKGK